MISSGHLNDRGHLVIRGHRMGAFLKWRETSPSTCSEATTQVPSASQAYVPPSSVDTRLMYKRATFQSCSTTTLRPSARKGCPFFLHRALTGLEYWQMNSAGWFSTTRMSSISLTTSTVGSEVGVRGHRIRANIRRFKKMDMPKDIWALEPQEIFRIYAHTDCMV